MSAEPALLIRGARLIDPAAGFDGLHDLLLRDGKVSFVAPGSSLSECRVLEAQGLIAAPGFVDLHCHLREPGQEYKETIESGLRAAVQGGFTTVCAMPNTLPAMDNRSVVEFVLRTAQHAGGARLLPIGAVTLGREGKQLAELAELAEAGCVGFSDDGSPVADAQLMRRALEYASGLGLPIIDHCEEPSLARGGVMHEGWVSTRLGLKGQPSAAEESMVARDIQLAELTRSHVHIAHVSSAGSVALIRAAKLRGVHVTAEVTPHHLRLTHESVLYGTPGAPRPAYDTNARVNPPLREEADRLACAQALADGTIDCIATDHAPHASTDKQCEFDYAAPGISGLETALALVLGCVEAGELSLARAVEALTASPVAALGLNRFRDGIGTLAPNATADLVLFDPREEWIVDPAAFQSHGHNTPLAGRRVRGRVVAAIVDGTLAYVQDRRLNAVPSGIE